MLSKDSFALLFTLQETASSLQRTDEYLEKFSIRRTPQSVSDSVQGVSTLIVARKLIYQILPSKRQRSKDCVLTRY